MKPIRKVSARKYGDKVASIASPIARIIDSVLGTDLVNCASCKERQNKLNKLF